MTDRWTDKLSEYLDGELAAEEREALEAHLADCEVCETMLAELRRVKARAGALEHRPPRTDLWPGIAARIGARTADDAATGRGAGARRGRRGAVRRRFSFTVPQLAAAGLALMVLSASAAWLLLGEGARGAGPLATEDPGAPGLVATDTRLPAGFAQEEYGVAIAEVQRVLEANRSQLDSATIRSIEENLRIIDQAIMQARRALAEDPASPYLSEYLASTMRQKLEFLRQAAAMTGAAS